MLLRQQQQQHEWYVIIPKRLILFTWQGEDEICGRIAFGTFNHSQMMSLSWFPRGLRVKLNVMLSECARKRITYEYGLLCAVGFIEFNPNPFWHRYSCGGGDFKDLLRNEKDRILENGMYCEKCNGYIHMESWKERDFRPFSWFTFRTDFYY